MAHRGKLITFEGIDGSGKSTQIALLMQRLQEAKIPFCTAREPGGSAVGEQIRAILLDKEHSGLDSRAELFLFEAARAQLVQECIIPALAEGKAVILDRFTDSTVAYQGYGRGLDPEVIVALNRTATAGLVPDRTFLLDVPVNVGAQRVHSSRPDTGDRLDNESQQFRQKVREGYLILAKQEPERFTVIDATGTPEEIASHIFSQVREELAR